MGKLPYLAQPAVVAKQASAQQLMTCLAQTARRQVIYAALLNYSAAVTNQSTVLPMSQPVAAAV